MREIKFRAWDKEEKTMIYDVEKTYDYGCKGYGALETSFGDLLENEKFEVMQFTGLYDKNGKEIYEGDIIEKNGWEGEYYKVVYRDGCFYADALFPRLPPPLRNKYLKLDEHQFYVSGNVHDNSSLLEVKA